jgi:hypothetical protein
MNAGNPRMLPCKQYYFNRSEMIKQSAGSLLSMLDILTE